MAFKSYAWQGGFHQCYTIRCSELTEWVKNIQRQRFVSNQRPGLHVVLGQIKDDSLKKKQLSCSWKLSYCPLGCWANFLSSHIRAPEYLWMNARQQITSALGMLLPFQTKTCSNGEDRIHDHPHPTDNALKVDLPCHTPSSLRPP